MTATASFPALTRGHEAGALIGYAPGEFVVRAVDEGLMVTSGEFWTDIANACRYYHASIDDSAALTVNEQPNFASNPTCAGSGCTRSTGPLTSGEKTRCTSGAARRWSRRSRQRVASRSRCNGYGEGRLRQGNERFALKAINVAVAVAHNDQAYDREEGDLQRTRDSSSSSGS